MLKKLRRRLALLCTVITGAVLLAMALCALTISERQLNERNEMSFQSNVNAIMYKLQSDHTISDTWLAQSEAGDRLIIHIEDNGQSLDFPGAWTPATDRNILISTAQDTARSEFGLDLWQPAITLKSDAAVFIVEGEHHDRYRALVCTLFTNGGRQSLTVLRDMRDEERVILRQRYLYIALVLSGTTLLFAFSWWFAGRAIRPIKKSQQAQHEFIAAASHELRSPLAVIQTSASALLSAPVEAPQFAAHIERECARLARLVDDLLLLAGMDAKSWTVDMRPLDCDTLLIECYDAYTPLAGESGHILSLDLPDAPLPTIMGDAQRLTQVLSILIDNALAHTPRGTHIAIRPIPGAHTVRIEVADDGPGIPPEHAAHIFDRFYRRDRARSDKEHFGLGLSIAKEIAALHRGGLSLQDTPGGGATFVLEIETARGKDL